MSSNVLASAPREDSSLYPQLLDFRMQKVNEISATIGQLWKKYKRAKKVVNWSAQF